MVEDKRRHLRLPLDSRVFIELLSPKADHSEDRTIAQCNTLEVSRRGLSVSLESALTVHSILQIGVELPGPEQTIYLAAEVKWCEAMPGEAERYCAGFEIIDGGGTDFSQWQSILIEMDS
jgi:hypothetical protein